jgi:protein involved in polysaccharide export with SLBB domain
MFSRNDQGRAVSVGAVAGLLLCGVLAGAAAAQPMPDPVAPDVDRPGGNTTIPVTMPGGTEVLGAESSATSATAAPISLEEPINPDTYVCGPGDAFELNFWGRQNFRLRVAADLEGRTFISKVGFVSVSGKTLTAVRELVKQKVRSNYPGLRFDLVLVSPRTFLVHVAGNVKQPGSFAAHPVERVSVILARAGGVTGSRRRIAIRHKGGGEVTADLLLYELTGDTAHNPYVLDGDVIHVPFPEVVVTIAGAVRRPGIYELVKTKDLAELLDLAGGFTSAVARDLPIRLIRRNERQQETFHELRRGKNARAPNRALRDDDRIIVRGTEELQRSVLLIGAVVGADPLDTATASKRLPYIEGDTVLSLIERAGGIQAPGDLKRSYISRARAGDSPLLIPLDLEALMVRRDFKADQRIAMNDTIVIPPKQHSIRVEGAVVRAGLYPFAPGFGLSEYIALAGGRTRTARDMDEVKLIDPNGRTHSYRDDLKLSPGDAILVPERNFTRAEVVQIVIAGASLILSGVAITYAATR